jgi:hypothetical protein
LFEFPKIVQIVDVVAVAGLRGGFASGWDPDVVDAGGFEVWDGGEETLPVFVVIWDVPFEGLHHCHVFRRWFLLFCELLVKEGEEEAGDVPDSPILTIVSVCSRSARLLLRYWKEGSTLEGQCGVLRC